MLYSQDHPWLFIYIYLEKTLSLKKKIFLIDAIKVIVDHLHQHL